MCQAWQDASRGRAHNLEQIPQQKKGKHPNPSLISQIITSLLMALDSKPVIDNILIPIPTIYYSNGPEAQ